MKLVYLTIVFLMITNICFSQGVGINSDNTDPDAKAMLDIKATGQGLLIPRMKYADRPTPLTNNDYHKGMIIYATDGNGTDGPGFYYWDGTQWLIVGTGSGSVRWNEILPPNGNTSIAHNLYTTNFTFTGTTTDAFTMTNNSLTSGKIFSLTSTATGMTGSIANISLTGNNASNTGNLLYINSSGASTLAKALNINIASTNNLGNAVGSGGGIRFYFSGAHTGNGFQIDDATTSGTAMAINVNAITTGTGLNISSNSNSTTNSNKLLHVNRTGAISGGGNSIYGVYSEVSATSASGHNYAIYGSATGSSSLNYAGRFDVPSSTTGSGWTIYATNAATGPYHQYAIHAECYGSHGGGPNRGIYGRAWNSTVGNFGVTGRAETPGQKCYGVSGEAYQGTVNWGGYFFASTHSGVVPDTCYGIYATANSATINWSGYFTAAPSHFDNSSGFVAEFNRNGDDGTIISLKQGGTEEGTITVSGNTISYNAFTGSHYAMAEQEYEKGMLVSFSEGSNRYNNNLNSEIIYNVKLTSEPNDPKILGAFLGLQERNQNISCSNPYLIMAVGNGEVWVADNGTNLEPGDFLISSAIPGHAMKDLGKFEKSYVFAKVAEYVDWNNVSETINGIKHKKISVLFETFVVDNKSVNELKKEIEKLNSRLESIENIFKSSVMK